MTASEALAIAGGEIGVRESAGGVVKYNTWYYGGAVSGRAYPWCMAFIQWVFAQGGGWDLLPVRTASCGAMARAAKISGQWVTECFRPGDVAIYSFSKDRRAEHTGMIERLDGKFVISIEGNTSWVSNTSGGCVSRRRRSMKSLLGAVRPAYDEEETEMRYQFLEDIPAFYRTDVKRLLAAGIVNGRCEKDGKPVLDLSDDMVRLLVIGLRGGAFDSKLAPDAEPAT